MKLSLDIKTTLSQTLTPQQIQYLKLLQLPQIQLEQYVYQELEQNPMLEQADDEEILSESEEVLPDAIEPPRDRPLKDADDVVPDVQDDYQADVEDETGSIIDDDPDPFEFYKMIAQEDVAQKNYALYNEDDSEDNFQIKDSITFYEDLMQQLRFLPLSDEEYLLGEQIVGNVDEDGYLRRDLQEIVDETNILIAEMNLDSKMREERLKREQRREQYNPAWNYSVSEEVQNILKNHNGEAKQVKLKEADSVNLKEVTLEQAEKILKLIQSLDPPGIASRNLQECLIAQCKVVLDKNKNCDLALKILTETYDAFTKKHFHVIKKQLKVSDDEIRKAFDLIKRLNPKPGGSLSESLTQTVIPDFIIEKDPESNELLITVNDSSLPVIKLSDAYKKIRSEAKYKMYNKETKDWIRNKYEDAKFLIQAIRQRKSTMLKVMTTIAAKQRDFFDIGPAGLKPLIYKDIAEATGLDISTVCRIVNGKYVQTEFGTFELKSFFSESLPTLDGEEVATKVIKQVLKEIIDNEPKNKPYSDQILVQQLKKRGYKVARRTIAKYREQMKIPVARLRREL